MEERDEERTENIKMKNIGRKEEIKAGREVAEAGRDIKA
jgi:hypothetical protein